MERSRDAVSSCVVIQEPDKVVYLIASNHLLDSQLTTVAQALERIMIMVPTAEDWTNEDDTEIRDVILGEVLALSWCSVYHRYTFTLDKTRRGKVRKQSGRTTHNLNKPNQ